MSGGGGYSSSKGRPRDVSPSEYKALRPGVATDLTNLFRNPASYQGQLYAPIRQNESDILAGLQTAGRNPFGQGATREELLNTIQGRSAGFQSLLDEAVGAASKDITNYAQDQNLENRALFGRAGQTLSESSPFAMAQAKSNAGILDALQKASVGIRLPSMMQERQNQLSAIGMLNEQNQGDLSRELAILEAQGLPRAIEEQGISRGVDLFKEQQQRIMQAMAMLAQITSPTIGTSTDSKSINMNAGICWVADLLFGEGSKKALAARSWAKAHADHWFVRVYAEHGERWVEALKAHPRLQGIVAPVWERMAQLGAAGVV